MRRSFLIFMLTVWVTSFSEVDSQISIIRESIDSINAILKSYPYHDGFNDVSFINAISITKENELVVEMSFSGPFKWVYSAKISDLNLAPKNDACRESPSFLCWVCLQKEPGQVTSCIKADMVFTEGSTETEYASNICVSFSGRAMICDDLNKRFQRLFNNITRTSE